MEPAVPGPWAKSGLEAGLRVTGSEERLFVRRRQRRQNDARDDKARSETSGRYQRSPGQPALITSVVFPIVCYAFMTARSQLSEFMEQRRPP